MERNSCNVRGTDERDFPIAAGSINLALRFDRIAVPLSLFREVFYSIPLVEVT